MIGVSHPDGVAEALPAFCRMLSTNNKNISSFVSTPRGYWAGKNALADWTAEREAAGWADSTLEFVFPDV